jgi:putative ABC transport system permease protein
MKPPNNEVESTLSTNRSLPYYLRSAILDYFPSLAPFYMSMRNLRSRPWRTLLTTLGITLGVAVVLAIEITNISTLDSLEQIFGRAVGKAELLVIPNADEETLDDDLLSRVMRTPGVKIAAPTIWVRTVLEHDSPGTEIIWGAGGIQVGRFLEIRGIDPSLDSEVRVYEFTSGTFPDIDQYEAIIPQRLSEEKELAIGDDLSIVTPYGIEKLEIIGVLADEGAGLINDGSVAFTSFEVIQDIFDLGGGLNEIAVQAEAGIGNDPQALSELKSALSKRLAGEARTIYPAARGELVPRMLDSYQIGLMFFSIIAVFVGAFLIYNTFSMTVIERTREIGMLRAIGMGRRQVLGLVLSEAGIISVFGALSGVGAGVLLAHGLLILLGGFIFVDQTLISVTAKSLFLSVGIGFLVTLLAALMPALQASNISPLEALRTRSKTSQRIRPLVWISGLVLLFVGWAALYQIDFRPEMLIPAGGSGLMLFLLGAVLTIPLSIGALEQSARLITVFIYGNEGRLGSANIHRSVSRTMLTVACFMVALVMIIGVGSLSHSFKQDVEGWVNNALGGDLYVSAPDPMRESFATQLMDVSGVQAVSPTFIHTVRVASSSLPEADEDIEDTLLFTAIEPALFRQVGDMEFITDQGEPEDNWHTLTEGSAVFISSVVADELAIKKGDTLTLLTRRGEHAFIVAAVTTDFSGQGYVITGTYTDLKRWFSESGVGRFTLKVENGYEIQTVAQEIEDRFEDRYNIDVTSTETIKASIFGLLDQAFLLFDVLSMIGFIIGALGVINTLTMNVLERKQELGSLRSLGMTRAQMVRMVLSEALALSVIGCVYGLFFGYIISNVFVDTLVTLTSYEIAYQFSIRPYLLGLVVTFVVSQIAAFGPAQRAAHVNIIEALKHE